MNVRACLALLVFTLLTVSSTLPARQEDIDKEFEEGTRKFQQTDDPEEKVGISRDFLLKHPESKYTQRLLGVTWNIYINELHRPDSFIELAEHVRRKVENADLARRIDFMLIDAYGEAGDRSKLTALARTLAAGEHVTFNTLYPIIQAANSAGEWQMVLDYCGQADRFASAEEFRKEFPNGNLTEKELEQRGKNRKGILLTYSGWAKGNLGRRAEALDDFATADQIVIKNYLGFSERGLDLFWGKTLLEDGKVDAAIDKLSRGAIFGWSDEMKAAFREAYDAKYHDAEGFDLFVENLRKKIAPPIDDFTLPNFQGEKLTMSSLKGKVVLLAFWHPN